MANTLVPLVGVWGPSSPEPEMPIIASSDRSHDLEPYGTILFGQEPDKFNAIFPCDFPQGDRAVEEAFLRRFFSDEEIRVQGGASGDGVGFRFLKQAWLWAAHWNLHRRVPAVAAQWIAENQSIVSDPEMKKRVFEPSVEPSTFFSSKEMALYGEKLLKVVIKCLQYQLHDPPPFPAHSPPVDSECPASLAHDTSTAAKPSTTNIATEDAASKSSTATNVAMNNTQQPAGAAAQAQHNAQKAPVDNAHPQAGPMHSQAQTEVQQTAPGVNHGKVQRHHHQQNGDTATFEGDNRGGHSTRGSHGSTSHANIGNRGARAGGKTVYGRQDARYQSELPTTQTYDPHGGAMPPMQPRTVSASSSAPGQAESMPSMPPQFVGQPPLMQTAYGQPMYGYPGPTNFQVQYQHHMYGPMNGPMNFPPGFSPHHPQPFGDRSNFPNDGRSLGDESRLFDPDKPKQHKYGSNGSSVRANKTRTQSIAHRGGNRAHNNFGQTGGHYSRDGHSFHRPTGSAFFGPAGAGQVHNDHRFSMPQRDTGWQPPYWGPNENGMTVPGYEQTPQMPNNILQSALGTDAAVNHSSTHDAVSTQGPQQPSVSYPRGHHQRIMSKTMPCDPYHCNKYAIGEQCTYATKLVIFQVPTGMSPASFAEDFTKFGTVEEVSLSENHDASQAYPDLIHRGPSWVRFANVDSAREALKARGQPWKGGPTLFAEVAGEYWNPAVPSYRPRLSGTNMHPEGSATWNSSRIPSTNNGASVRTFSSGEASATAPANDTQKKKGTNNYNNKRKTKNKKSGLNDESLDGVSKANASWQDGQAKRASPIEIFTKAPPEPEAISAAAKPAANEVQRPSATMTARDGSSATVSQSQTMDEAKEMTSKKEPSMGEQVVKSLKPTTTSTVVASPHVAPVKVEHKPVEVGEVAKPENVSCQDFAKPSDDQVDDSFHTADGSHGNEQNSHGLNDGISVATADSASSISTEAPSPNESNVLAVGHPGENSGDISMTGPIENADVSSAAPSSELNVSASTQDTSGAETSLPEISEQGLPTATVAPAMNEESVSAAMPKRSVTIVIPPIDTRSVVSSGKEDSDELVQTARSVSGTSMSEAPTSAFVTAPSTPAIPEPSQQVKSKKELKSKGPAQTESLSLFAKPKSRKPSKTKPKPPPGRSSGPAGVIDLQPSGQLKRHVPHVEHVVAPATVEGDDKASNESQAADGSDVSHIEHVGPSAGIEDDDNAEIKSLAADGSDLGASTQSSHEALSGSTWTTALTSTVLTYLTMTPLPSPATQVMKSAELLAGESLLPEKTLEEQIPAIQLSDIDEDSAKSENPQDLDELPQVESAAGLGISGETAISDTAAEHAQSPGSDESKPRKKKPNKKRSKATASVTIASNITVGPRANEPIHEYRGNDATSDSSSQTLGRTSPATRRPSSKQIDESKQPKPLLEQRVSRQNRKKHISVHRSKIADDSTDSTEETAVAIAETPAVAPKKNWTVIFTPFGDGRFMEEAENAAMTVDSRVLKPVATPETPKSLCAPEKPYDSNNVEEDDTPSPAVEQSKEKIRQMEDKEAAQKKKFA